MRILLQTAVAVRFIGFGHADEEREDKNALGVPVGELKRQAAKSASEPLCLREACNKIIHARNIVLDSNRDGNPYDEFIKPRVFCYEEFEKRVGWKATIQIVPFVEISSSILYSFA